ncbi:hypothetical protein GWI33_012005 [Rhynchophorus ferrugineus]|uniref:Uncharacterized protein n=1 Tax=Rhynchophorus ferrugineus TaxID=354439 RepID=A0A834IRM4_RHYFE|nr:hypothetical protein GWI33_012005 [Rhynchophorus ferrugineus]
MVVSVSYVGGKSAASNDRRGKNTKTLMRNRDATDFIETRRSELFIGDDEPSAVPASFVRHLRGRKPVFQASDKERERSNQ